MEDLIRKIEAEQGRKVQISIEEPLTEEKSVHLTRPGQIFNYEMRRNTYGSLQQRPCEVVALPKTNAEMKHDQALIEGKYSSIDEINKKIIDIERIDFFCYYRIETELERDFLQHLKKRYTIEKKEIIHGHDMLDWYFIDRSPINIGDWKEKRADLFREAVGFLKERKKKFRYHDLTATHSGVYVSETDFENINLDKQILKEKIAELKIDPLR